MEAQKLESRLEPSVFPQKQLVFKRNYSDQGFFQSTEMSVFDLEIGSAALFSFFRLRLVLLFQLMCLTASSLLSMLLLSSLLLSVVGKWPQVFLQLIPSPPFFST